MSDEVPPGTDVYRVPPRSMIHAPAGVCLPTWTAFSPTDADKASHPVRVSVWDARSTSPQQAVALRERTCTAEGPLTSFAMLVADVLAVAAEHERVGVRVMLDPDGLDPALAGLPGSEGHAGIEGLMRERGTPRIQHQAFLASLASRCRPA